MAAAVIWSFISGFSLGARKDDKLALIFFLQTIPLYSVRVALDNIRYLRCVLLCFEAISGLKIDLAKSELGPFGCVPNVNALTRILDCRFHLFP
jgi:hypothetical protein